jgi:hydrogenase expression/formation protein HypD
MLYEKFLRNKKLIKIVLEKIKNLKIKRKVNLMEVCGTHTFTFFRFGLRKIIPSYINLISGPGCPVCITEEEFIDKAVILSQDKNNIITTFGDLMRVKGSFSSLEEERAKGANIKVVYCPDEALKLAEKTRKRVIFLGIGFETTAPLIASVIKEAKRKRVKNLFLLSGHRLIPPAMEVLCKDKDINIDGFICPGHVSAIIGEIPYEKIVKRYKKGCIITGFEPLDMVLAIYQLLIQIKRNIPKLENEYKRVVKRKGNLEAKKLLKEVFKVVDASWRGLGAVKKSGLELNQNYQEFDAQKLIRKKIKFNEKKKDIICLCPDVIKGKIPPLRCPQFKKVCTPTNPIGPCMISFEGSCRIYYEYYN